MTTIFRCPGKRINDLVTSMDPRVFERLAEEPDRKGFFDENGDYVFGSDELLLKAGPLTDKETEIIKLHTTIGENILSNSSHPLIKMAESIALNHHERWNGTGYPKGIKSGAIPIEGRIVNICDQYDALMNERPYKPSLNHRETFRIITEGDGRTMPDHFDPRVLNAFREVSEVFEEIYHSNRD